ncbi:glycosyltransferase [Marinobacter goseongensis]|nr:glycosyltransferase [Marinobacter goseongensis]
MFGQITSDCEVVLVDDGSTDNSVDQVRRNFSDALHSGQLMLICTENAGPGAARNTWIQAARGTYIAFLDSDDFILPGCIARILAILSDSAPDIVQFNVLRVLEDNLSGQHLIACHRPPDGLDKMDAISSEIFGVGKWFPPSRIFTRKIILANPFPAERAFYEGLQLLPFIFFQDVTIFLVVDPLIAYRDNPHGTIRNHKLEHANTMLSLFARFGVLPPSVPCDLTRVQLARSIVFVALVLRLRKIDLCDLRNRILW